MRGRKRVESMPAPHGNKNAAKAKDWERAIRAALHRYEDNETKKGEALERIAKKVVEKAIAGDKDAIKEIGDRLDGKAPQSIDATVNGNLGYEPLRIPVEQRHPLESAAGAATDGDPAPRN